MSYLHVPRICIDGSFEAGGVTANNVLAAREEVNTPNFKPPPAKRNWHNNNLASNQFSLSVTSTRVVSAWDQNGPVMSDPVLGAAVFGDGIMADLDPEHRRVTDLIGFQLAVRLLPSEQSLLKEESRPIFSKRRLEPPAARAEPVLKGRLKTTQLRDFWLTKLIDPPVFPVSTIWQSVLCGLTWSSDVGRSKVLSGLREVSSEALSVRLVLTYFAGGTGKILAVIGPHHRGHPEQIIPGRRLTSPDGKNPYPGFPVASFLVDEGRRKLIVDLGNLIPRSLSPTRNFVSHLTAKVGDKIIGNPRELTVFDWLKSAGLVEWDLSSPEQDLLAGSPLRLEFTQDGQPDPSTLNEHAQGKYADVDRRSLRMNPGDCVAVSVYARKFGKPLGGEVLRFGLEQQCAGDPVGLLMVKGDPYYPADETAKINSVPAEVFDPAPPFSVKTDANGYAELRLKVKPGPFDLPRERQSINSQLYFLGDPDGWQRWGALGPEVGRGCALTVLVFNKTAVPDNPRWCDVYPILARYARLYPFMRQIIDLGQEKAVKDNALRICERLMAPADAIEHMPVTRDLSADERRLILKYLDWLLRTHQGG